MDGTFERTLSETWLLLPEEVPAEEYACRLLEKNPGKHLLRLSRRREKDGVQYAFAIPKGNSLAGIYRLRSMNFKEVARIMDGIALAVEETEENLLDPDHLILTPELIFAMPDLDHIGLCCHPGFRKDFFEQLRELIRYFLRKIDHQDRKGTEAAYRLFEISEQEFFRFEDLMEEIGKGCDAVPVREPEPSETLPEDMPVPAEASAGKNSPDQRWPEALCLFACLFSGLLICWLRLKTGGWERVLLPAPVLFGLAYSVLLLLRRKRHRGRRREAGGPASGPGASERGRRPQPAPDAPKYGTLVPLWEEGEEAVIRCSPFVIGKLHGEVQLMLDDPVVSRIHARITREESGLVLTDCRSANGTWVNGVRLRAEAPCTLERGDEIRFADFPYRLE